MLLLLGYFLKPKERPQFPLKIGMFFFDDHCRFWTFSILWLWNKFSEKARTYYETGVPFLVESTTIENATFPYKMPSQKPMLRQIELVVQNGSITKDGVFHYFFFLKI